MPLSARERLSGEEAGWPPDRTLVGRSREHIVREHHVRRTTRAVDLGFKVALVPSPPDRHNNLVVVAPVRTFHSLELGQDQALDTALQLLFISQVYCSCRM